MNALHRTAIYTFQVDQVSVLYNVHILRVTFGFIIQQTHKFERVPCMKHLRWGWRAVGELVILF